MQEKVSDVVRLQLERLMREEFQAARDEQWFPRSYVAAVAHLKKQTIEVMAMRGDGPAYTLIAGRAFSTKRDIVKWMSKGTRFTSTADRAAQASRGGRKRTATILAGAPA